MGNSANQKNLKTNVKTNEQIVFYQYDRCDTCRKALKFLQSQGVGFESRPIVERPPSRSELERMLKHVKANGGSIKNLFNTSGQQYRELGVGQKLKDGISESEALELLAANGKLIKRPFLLTESAGLVGFKESEWTKLISR